MGPWAPQELLSRREAARHMSIFQVPFLHKMLCEESPVLPIHDMIPPSIQSHVIQ